MLISHKNKFITIDIPKTASRSLRESLCPLGIIDVVGKPDASADFYQHGTALDCINYLCKTDYRFRDYYSFCIVRNPWDRYFSFFKYFKNYAEKYKIKDKSIAWNEPEINQGKMCVNLFKDKSDQETFSDIIKSNRAQSDYYLDQNNEVVISHIGEFNNIKNEFNKLCKNAQIKTPQLRHGNKSKNKENIRNLYNKELISLVAEKEKSVIKLKNYNFKND
jgi:hypothetical protein